VHLKIESDIHFLINQALLQAQASEIQSPARLVLDWTVGILFLGTPFRGSKIANSATHRVSLAQSLRKDAYKGLVADLDRHNEKLDQLVDDFGNLIHQLATHIPVKCFYETRKTNITKAVSRGCAKYFPKWKLVSPRPALTT
jgi:hypothetical protein